MNEIFRIPTVNSRSDNRKSKIENRKLVGIFAIAITFVFGGVEARAQQPKKGPADRVSIVGRSS